MRSTDTENCLCFSPNDDYFVRVHGIGGIPTTLKGEPDQIGVCMVRTDRETAGICSHNSACVMRPKQ